jgi:hypothetical protein
MRIASDAKRNIRAALGNARNAGMLTGYGVTA